MSHVLGLLFEYHRYKKDTILRVYADDLLVEEILLTKDISVKSKESIKRPPIIVPGPPINRIELPEKLFLFEIDESNLKKSIRIEAINDNNNYTNGFMTDFSYLSFHGLFLIPRCLLYEDNWRKLARFINKKWDTEDPKEIANLAKPKYNINSSIVVGVLNFENVIVSI